MSDDDKPDFRAEIDRLFNDAMAQASDGEIRDGFAEWMPVLGNGGAFFGVERVPETPMFMITYPCKWKLTLRERIKGAWRGMVNGWRGAL